jgi:hypothetical protein
VCPAEQGEQAGVLRLGRGDRLAQLAHRVVDLSPLEVDLAQQTVEIAEQGLVGTALQRAFALDQRLLDLSRVAMGARQREQGRELVAAQQVGALQRRHRLGGLALAQQRQPEQMPSPGEPGVLVGGAGQPAHRLGHVPLAQRPLAHLEIEAHLLVEHELLDQSVETLAQAIPQAHGKSAVAAAIDPLRGLLRVARQVGGPDRLS